MVKTVEMFQVGLHTKYITQASAAARYPGQNFIEIVILQI